MALPEINPALFVYIFVQTFLFVPFVASLSVVRMISASGPSRIAALCAMALALAALFLQFGPVFLGLYDGPLPVFAGEATRALDGLALPLAPSLALLVSGMVRGWRFRWIDVLHVAGLVGFLGLYVVTKVA